MPLAPHPVVDAQHTRCLGWINHYPVAQLPQQRRAAGQNAKLLGQTSSRSSAQNPCNLLQCHAQASRATCTPWRCLRQPLGEYLLPTSGNKVRRPIANYAKPPKVDFLLITLTPPAKCPVGFTKSEEELLFPRHVTPLPQRNVVYFSSGAYTRS